MVFKTLAAVSNPMFATRGKMQNLIRELLIIVSNSTSYLFRELFGIKNGI